MWGSGSLASEARGHGPTHTTRYMHLQFVVFHLHQMSSAARAAKGSAIACCLCSGRAWCPSSWRGFAVSTDTCMCMHGWGGSEPERTTGCSDESLTRGFGWSRCSLPSKKLNRDRHHMVANFMQDSQHQWAPCSLPANYFLSVQRYGTSGRNRLKWRRKQEIRGDTV